MYRQQSLITLDQFYEIKPLTKLESILSFIDYLLFEEVFPYDSHKRGPKGYSKKQLFNTLIAMQIEQLSDIKALVMLLKSDIPLSRTAPVQPRLRSLRLYTDLSSVFLM